MILAPSMRNNQISWDEVEEDPASHDDRSAALTQFAGGGLVDLSFKDTSDLIGKWVTILAALAGGAVWLNTYVESRHSELSDRQKQSVEFFREYNKPDALKLRRDFFELKIAVHREVDPLTDKLVGDINAAMAKGQKLTWSTTTRLILSENKGFEMRRLVEIFDQASACVDIGVCDKDVTYRFLGGDAYEVRYLLTDFIAQVRTTRPGFGKGIDTLAYAPKD